MKILQDDMPRLPIPQCGQLEVGRVSTRPQQVSQVLHRASVDQPDGRRLYPPVEASGTIGYERFKGGSNIISNMAEEIR